MCPGHGEDGITSQCLEWIATAMGCSQLHAAGFNAWNQALLEPKDCHACEEPNDLRKFTRVLDGDPGAIRDVQACLSYTLGKWC